MQGSHQDITAVELEEVARVFSRALDFPTEARTRFLDEACAGRPVVRAEVASLLAAAAAAGPFLERIDADQAADLLRTARRLPLEEEQIGPYRIVREIGRGGMGVVYLAERAAEHQQAQFEQRVALKVVKRGMDTDAILRRFLHERQILASLNHPGIARLLDGGMAEDGRPYFVMEYVEGEPLTTYADARRLSVEARLQLFAHVGEAVQHAHRHLVIHRDLKPSNILVTEDGSGLPQVKLLDFGIAKLLDPEAEARTLHTEAGTRMMTPAYAAPEQALGEPVTTATDVYSLGVLLYELLTGHRPYPFAHTPPGAAARLLDEAPPTPPSTAAGRFEAGPRSDSTPPTLTPEQVSRARSTDPKRLRRRLSGDLDAIVLTALRREPERRYASAAAFTEEVQRHLTGLPVQARRDTVGYRVSKFVRRHRAGVAAAATIVLTLLAGLAVSLGQTNRARQEAATAEAVTDFVVRLFEQADPDASPGEEVTARALLEHSPRQIEQELADQPKVQAELLQVVSRLHMALGLYEETPPLLQRALALRQAQYGTDHPETAQTLALLGTLASAQSNYTEAETRLREALRILEAAHGPNHLDVAETLGRLSKVLWRQDNLVEAESLYRRVLDIRHRHLPPTHPDLAEAMSSLAYVLRRAGNYGDEPDSLYRHALALSQQHHGDLHSATLEAMSAYSNFLQDKGDLKQAAALSRRHLGLSRQLFGSEHPSVGHAYHTLARLMSIQGNFEAADSLYRQSLRVYRAVYGMEHAYVGVTLSNLGANQSSLGNFDEAERLLHEALAVYRKRYGPAHWYVAISTNELARLAKNRGALRQAEGLYRQALALFRTSRPPGHPVTGTSLQELGTLLVKQGRPAEAEPLLREAEQSWAKAFEEDDWRLLKVRRDLGACLLALNRFEEAEAVLLQIYPILRQQYGATGTRTTRTRELLAELYTAWGKTDQATSYRAVAPSSPKADD